MFSLSGAPRALLAVILALGTFLIWQGAQVRDALTLGHPYAWLMVVCFVGLVVAMVGFVLWAGWMRGEVRPARKPAPALPTTTAPEEWEGGDWVWDPSTRSWVRAVVDLNATIALTGFEEWHKWNWLREVARCPDPGNFTPHTDGDDRRQRDLALYDVQEDLYGPVRLLVGVNGSPESDGTYERKAIAVPKSYSDPVAAAAGSYNVPRELYLMTAVRT